MLKFYLQAQSAKGWSPKGRRGKENTSPVKQQVGFKPGTFGPQSNALITLPQCQSNNKQQTQNSIFVYDTMVDCTYSDLFICHEWVDFCSILYQHPHTPLMAPRHTVVQGGGPRGASRLIHLTTA